MPADIQRDIENALQRYIEGQFQTKYSGESSQHNIDHSSSKLLDKDAMKVVVESNVSASNAISRVSTAPSPEPLDKGKLASANNANKIASKNTPQASRPLNQQKQTPKRRAQVSNDPSPTAEVILRACLRQKSLELNTLRQTWHHEVDSLRNTISQHTQTELSLRAEFQHLVIARQAHELAGKDPLEYELFQLNQTVWSLNRRGA